MGTFDFLKIDGERWKVKNLCVMCEKKKRKVLVEGEWDNVSNLGIATFGGKCNQDKVES